MSESLSVLVIDAQHLDLSSTNKEKLDLSSKLIAVSAMLSSVLIYTQRGELDEQHFLEFFNPIAHLHKILKRDAK